MKIKLPFIQYYLLGLISGLFIFGLIVLTGHPATPTSIYPNQSSRAVIISEKTSYTPVGKLYRQKQDWEILPFIAVVGSSYSEISSSDGNIEYVDDYTGKKYPNVKDWEKDQTSSYQTYVKDAGHGSTAQAALQDYLRKNPIHD